jgi:hypothetical protein
MPEPLTTPRELTIFVCPECGAWEGGPGSRSGRKEWALWCDGACTHERVEMVSTLVFSEGDMQAVQEMAEKAEAARDQARADLVTARRRRSDAMDALEALPEGAREWTLDYDAGRAEERKNGRAAVVAEALRDLLATHQGSSNEAARARRKAQAALEGVDRSHELVPLGTQEALVMLSEAVARWSPRCANLHGAAAVDAALKAAESLVEGVERTHTPSGDGPC